MVGLPHVDGVGVGALARLGASYVDDPAIVAAVACVRRARDNLHKVGAIFVRGEVGVVFADKLVHRAGILESGDATRTSS